MNITKKLQCLAQLSNPTGQSSSSEPTYTDITTINCFVYGSSKRVYSRETEQEITLDFKVLVDQNAVIAMNGLLNNVIDPLGNLLFEEGRIVAIEPIVHYSEGLVARELGVVRW